METYTDWQTPIHPLHYEDGRNRFYIKRDDLLPFYWGGNKVRIAAKYFADMKARGHDCLIAYGNSRSNLCRVLATMCKAADLPCLVITPADDSGTRVETINSRVIRTMGAEIIPCLKSEAADTVAGVMSRCRERGQNPYYIYGDRYGKGNEKTAVQAYFEVYQEIRAQENEMGIHFDQIFLASGTGITQAGLISGQLSSGDAPRIIGISAAREAGHASRGVQEHLEGFFAENLPAHAKTAITITDEYLAGGYGCFHQQILQVIRDVLTYEGITLDPTYTGKAFWGMQEYLKREQISGQHILFLHTGGLPLFFDQSSKILINPCRGA